MLRPLLAAAAVFATALTASAADLPTHKTPESPLSPFSAWNWTGVYAGLEAGPAWGNSSSSFYTIGGFPLGSASDRSDGKLRIAVQAGYRYQTPSKLVAGVQGSLDYLPGISETTGAITAKRTGRIYGSLAGQLGYSFGDLLPYALAGFSVGASKNTLTAFGVSDTTSPTRLGLLLGAGLDYHIAGNWVISAQYQVDWSDRYRFNFPNNGFYIENQERAQSLLFGVSYKF